MSENHRPPIRATDPVDRLNAALEGRYHVERELGRGGMVTVYLAADLRHELAAVVGADHFGSCWGRIGRVLGAPPVADPFS